MLDLGGQAPIFHGKLVEWWCPGREGSAWIEE